MSPRAQATLEKWLADPRKRPRVVPYVRASRAKVIYQLSPSDVTDVARCSAHALGKANKNIANSIGEVRDWHPAFAFEHVLHHALETLAHVPTYQEFRLFTRDDELAHEMLLEPARAITRRARARHNPDHVAQAVRWRIGNAYYSFLKELYAVAVLRDAGIDVRYHVLADVLLRTDLWVEDICVSLYVKNRFFKDDYEGRKLRARDVLGDGPFRFADIGIPKQRRFGVVHLPDASELLKLAEAAGL